MGCRRSPLCKNHVVGSGEEICEVVTGKDNPGLGMAFADIEHSEAHLHRRTRETYVLVSGALHICLEDFSNHYLTTPGESLVIPIGWAHRAKSMNPEPARVLVISIPAWSPEDHILIKK